MFILSSVSSGLEFWSVNHTSIQKFLQELKVFKNMRHLGKISNNWLNVLFGRIVGQSLKSCQ